MSKQIIIMGYIEDIPQLIINSPIVSKIEKIDRSDNRCMLGDVVVHVIREVETVSEILRKAQITVVCVN